MGRTATAFRRYAANCWTSMFLPSTRSGEDYCANEPTPNAIGEATIAKKGPTDELRVMSLVIGTYPAPKLGKSV
jgi:hypothetical protein